MVSVLDKRVLLLFFVVRANTHNENVLSFYFLFFFGSTLLPIPITQKNTESQQVDLFFFFQERTSTTTATTYFS